MQKKRHSIRRAFFRFKRRVIDLLRGLTFLCPFCPILPRVIQKYRISKAFDILIDWEDALKFEMSNFFENKNVTKKQQRSQFDELIQKRKNIFEEMDLYAKWRHRIFINSESKDNFIQYLKVIWKSILEYKEISERSCVLQGRQVISISTQTDPPPPPKQGPYPFLTDISAVDFEKMVNVLPGSIAKSVLMKCNKDEESDTKDTRDSRDSIALDLLKNIDDRDQKKFLSDMSGLLQQSSGLLFTLQYNYFQV
jgi:hypothetical protein